eukprot:scaffold2253_cov119-Cylindrotheca_fusiformis.AAC.17
MGRRRRMRKQPQVYASQLPCQLWRLHPGRVSLEKEWARNQFTTASQRNLPFFLALTQYSEEEDGFVVGGEIDMGVSQEMESNLFTTMKITSEISKAWEYMETVSLRKSVREKCKNSNKMCTIWALEGECEKNPKCESYQHIFHHAHYHFRLVVLSTIANDTFSLGPI